MSIRRLIVVGLLAAVASPATIWAQTSSLGARKRQIDGAQPPKGKPREEAKRETNRVYRKYAWTAVKRIPPKTLQVNDLITVVVRLRTKYEGESALNTWKRWDFKSQLDAFIKPTGGGVGASLFRRGKPNIEYEFGARLKSDADMDREDRLTTRITTKIIDVKPNGTLVLEGRGLLTFQDEVTAITITGMCRKEDVTPDNTVLSSQVAELEVKVDNEGALRASSSRGWITKLIDLLRPF